MKAHTLMALASMAMLAACSGNSYLPIVLSGSEPDDPNTRIRPTNHVSPVGDYNHREPVDPGPWRQLNDEQAPKKRN